MGELKNKMKRLYRKYNTTNDSKYRAETLDFIQKAQ